MVRWYQGNEVSVKKAGEEDGDTYHDESHLALFVLNLGKRTTHSHPTPHAKHTLTFFKNSLLLGYIPKQLGEVATRSKRKREKGQAHIGIESACRQVSCPQQE
jgi:hypothetical protein